MKMKNHSAVLMWDFSQIILNKISSKGNSNKKVDKDNEGPQLEKEDKISAVPNKRNESLLSVQTAKTDQTSKTDLTSKKDWTQKSDQKNNKKKKRGKGKKNSGGGDQSMMIPHAKFVFHSK